MAANPPASADALVAPFSGLSRAEKVFTIIGSLLGLLLAALDQTIVATAGPAIQQRPPHRALALRVDHDRLPGRVDGAGADLRQALRPVRPAPDPRDRHRDLPRRLGCCAGSRRPRRSSSPFRAVQGVGSAALFTTAFAVVADLFAPAERGKYQGIFGGVFGLSSVIGPLLGGFITDHFGWHWVFFVNLPIGAVALAVHRRPACRRSGRPARGRAAIDWLGALALAVAAWCRCCWRSASAAAPTSPRGERLAVAVVADSRAVRRRRRWALVAFILVERRRPTRSSTCALFGSPAVRGRQRWRRSCSARRSWRRSSSCRCSW